jgi:hypothetical protein
VRRNDATHPHSSAFCARRLGLSCGSSCDCGAHATPCRRQSSVSYLVARIQQERRHAIDRVVGADRPRMVDYLRTALDTYATVSHRVVLFLNSAGGQVDVGDRVIHILDEIKPTHRLVTVVLDGELCASMCIPIFLQADDRLAAGRATGSSMRSPSRAQMARSKWRRRYDCSIDITSPLGSRRIGSKVSCLSSNERTSGKPAAISSAPRPASSCIRRKNGTERVVAAPSADADRGLDTNGPLVPGGRRRSFVCRHPQRRDDPPLATSGLLSVAFGSRSHDEASRGVVGFTT